MPKIEKVKNKKPLPVARKVTKTKPKPSPVEYYNCLLASAQQDWFDPQTGKKKKITACCQDCKTKAPALNKQREQEITKLINSYRQTGVSLSKLLRPIK